MPILLHSRLLVSWHVEKTGLNCSCSAFGSVSWPVSVFKTSAFIRGNQNARVCLYISLYTLTVCLGSWQLQVSRRVTEESWMAPWMTDWLANIDEWIQEWTGPSSRWLVRLLYSRSFAMWPPLHAVIGKSSWSLVLGCQLDLSIIIQGEQLVVMVETLPEYTHRTPHASAGQCHHRQWL